MEIAVLASGGGSNLKSIIDSIESGSLHARVLLVVSNNSDSLALERARRHGIPALHASSRTHGGAAELDRAILSAVETSGAGYIALAGYMKKLGTLTLSAYRDRIFNIHPALLPAFGGEGMYGMNVHRAVLASGATTSGVTIHLVTEDYDEGPILAQEVVPVLPDDDPETLQRRVLAVEHRLYPATLEAVGRGVIAVYRKPWEVIVRPIRMPGDFTEAAQVVREAFRTPAIRFSLDRKTCPTHPSFVEPDGLAKILASGGTFFAAYRDRRIVGCVGIEPSRDSESVWYVEKLAVLPELRGKGLGSLLLEHACRCAASAGGGEVSIGVMDDDRELKGWYASRGFSVTGTRTFAHLPFTVCFMTRQLPGPS